MSESGVDVYSNDEKQAEAQSPATGITDGNRCINNGNNGMKLQRWFPEGNRWEQMGAETASNGRVNSSSDIGMQVDMNNGPRGQQQTLKIRAQPSEASPRNYMPQNSGASAVYLQSPTLVMQQQTFPCYVMQGQTPNMFQPVLMQTAQGPDGNTVYIPLPQMSPPAPVNNQILKEEQRKAKRRQLCMINQRRYRERRRIRAEELEKEIDELNSKINEVVNSNLKLRGEIKQKNEHLLNARTQVVMDFMTIFRRGICIDPKKQDEREAQLSFLHSKFTTHVNFESYQGIHELVAQLEKYAYLHEEFHMHTYTVSAISPSNVNLAIRSNFLLDLVISERTIKEVYPYLMHDEGFPSVVGKKLCLNGSLTFFFEKAQICRVELEVDYVRAWVGLLNDVVYAARATSGGMISRTGLLECDCGIFKRDYHVERI